MSTVTAISTLASRRAALTARTPRQIAVPLLTPILFAVLIAPALKEALGGLRSHIDYTSFVSIGTIGLLIPLTCVFAGLSVIVDRDAGAQRELLAAPIPRRLLVWGNLTVAVALCVLQVSALMVVAVIRGADFHASASGIAWFVGAGLLFAVAMYGLAEVLVARMPVQEEYIGATPVVAVLPFFFAGALFPISALPGAITAFAKVLPLTHVLALMRYGLVDPKGTGLHDIWGMSNTTAEAWLSLGVIALFAVLLSVASVRLFTKSALR
jgi:ABC-type multidrug transport system permease subunit